MKYIKVMYWVKGSIKEMSYNVQHFMTFSFENVD